MANTKPLSQASDQTVSSQRVNQARIDMAACFRIAARENLHEGIDNHFSYAFGDGTFLVNRWGVHWSRMRASDLLRIDHEGHVIEGKGTVEKTAFFIHEAVHRLCPHAVVILHTHMPYTAALSCVEGGLNETLYQNSLFFLNDVVYESFGGLANDREEGERLASNIGDKHVAILNNHGAMVMATTPGIGIHDLYFLERAAQVQVLAQSQGKPLIQIPQDIADKTAHQLTQLDEDKETYFEVWKGMLDDTEPDYRSL